MYLIRQGKIEFSGTLKQIISYLKEVYEDYYLEEWEDQLQKDRNKLRFVLENLGLKLSERKPKR